jgi:hypothetical protein
MESAQHAKIITLTDDQKALRAKIDLIFRFMYDMGAIIPKTFQAHEAQVFILTQMLSTLVKHFHLTRNIGKVDTATKPSPQVIEVGSLFQQNMNLLFDALENLEKIETPTIPMATRQAPLFEKAVNKTAKEIEAVYAKPEIVGLNGMQIVK